MSNNAKVGGILSIIAGSIGVLWAAGILFMAVFLGWAMNGVNWYDGGYRYDSPPPPEGFFVFFAVFYGGFGVFLAAVAVLAIVGGIFALKRKHWGWALAGAIGSAFAFFPCGVAAIVFVSMAKPEFAQIAFPVGPPTPAAPPPPAAPAN